MDHSKVVFKDAARPGLLAGVKTVADAVGSTLGPKGKTVIIQLSPDQAPVVTKDGVTVSKAINLKNPLERLGALLIKQAAEKTNEAAGDGTTTATVLSHALIVEGQKLASAGYDTQVLCNSMQRAKAEVLKTLATYARQVSDDSVFEQIATVSANGDASIGKIIVDAFKKVGKDGIINVEDAKSSITTLELVDGTRFERGYLSPYFITHNDRMHAKYEDAKILITDEKINDIKKLIPVLEKALQAHVPLLIIAEDIEGDALQTLVVNRVKSKLPVVAVKAPGYGTHRDELLGDLCTMTGAKLVSGRTGLQLSNVTLNDLGTAKSVIVDSKTTTLITAGKTTQDVNARADELRLQLNDVTLDVEEITKLKRRIANLVGGAAIIRVGGVTELEMVERKHRIEDALHATRAAAEEGYLPGGGTALARAAQCLSQNSDPGHQVVLRACRAPVEKIVENANGSPAVVINELAKLQQDWGYNAAKGEYSNLIEDGVIDPHKVTRVALENAISVATTFLSFNACVFEDGETAER